MPRELFDECPWTDYVFRDEQPVASFMDDAPGTVQRFQLQPIARRVYQWHMKRDFAERAVILEFLRARGQGLESFYVEDPADAARVDVPAEPATGDGARVTFSLPTGTSDEERRWHPLESSFVAKVNGTPVTVSSVDRDARTFTLAAAPGVGQNVTASYTGLRLVRLRQPQEWAAQSYAWHETTLELEELLSD